MNDKNFKGLVAALVAAIAMALLMLVLPLVNPQVGAEIAQAMSRPAGEQPPAAAQPMASSMPEPEPETEPEPAGIRLPVQNILQNPQLPNGCEATSLAILLHYLGFGADKLELAETYIPRGYRYTVRRVTYGPNPADMYVGNPTDSSGFYVLPPALVKAANAYLAAQESPLAATSLTGAGEDELAALLEAGTPVVVWATKDFGPAEYSANSWVLDTTYELYVPYSNLHCMVLVGCDDDTFTLCNPLVAGWQTVPRRTFMAGYTALGSMAVAIEQGKGG